MQLAKLSTVLAVGAGLAFAPQAHAGARNATCRISEDVRQFEVTGKAPGAACQVHFKNPQTGSSLVVWEARESAGLCARKMNAMTARLALSGWSCDGAGTVEARSQPSAAERASGPSFGSKARHRADALGQNVEQTAFLVVLTD